MCVHQSLIIYLYMMILFSFYSPCCTKEPYTNHMELYNVVEDTDPMGSRGGLSQLSKYTRMPTRSTVPAMHAHSDRSKGARQANMSTVRSALRSRTPTE